MPQSPPIKRATRLGLDVELRAISNGGWRFPSHWHDDVQVIATVHGRGAAIVEGTAYVLPERALIVIPPRAVHTAHAAVDAGWTFQSLHVAPERLRLAGQLAPLIADATSDDPLPAMFGAVVAGLFARSTDVGRRFAAFTTMLGDRLQPATPGRVPAALLSARDDLGANFHRRETIAMVARRHGYSAGHFARAFAAAFHMPPHAWRLNARIEAVKQGLRGGATVAEAAGEAGFTNASHFSRLYRQATGVTARSYAGAFAPDRRPPA